MDGRRCFLYLFFLNDTAATQIYTLTLHDALPIYSPAADAGLRRGDVILEINREPVRNADDAVRMTETAKDKTTLLRVWREGNRHYIVVDESGGK